MNLRRVRAIAVKEFRHIARDRATFLLVTLMPSLLLIMLAYAISADVDHVPLAIIDLDRSQTSRAFLQQLSIGDELSVGYFPPSVDDAESLLLRNRVKAVMVVPPGFERELLSLRGFPLQVIIDGTEPQSGGFAVDQIGRRAEAFVTDALAEQFANMGFGPKALQPIDLRVRTWYNPSLKPSVDLIPGLISMVLGLPGMSVALTLAREREHGTLEQLMASPIGRAELLLGKMGPYAISGMANVVLTTVVASLWFRVPFHGSFPLFLLLSLPYFLAILSLGMIVGVFIHTQPAALALSMLVIFFPGFFLTGIFFPTASMPDIVRLEALALPGTHYAAITKGLFVNGSGLEVLWPNGVALSVMALLYLGLAALFFRKKLA